MCALAVLRYRFPLCPTTALLSRVRFSEAMAREEENKGQSRCEEKGERKSIPEAARLGKGMRRHMSFLASSCLCERAERQVQTPLYEGLESRNRTCGLGSFLPHVKLISISGFICTINKRTPHRFSFACLRVRSKCVSFFFKLLIWHWNLPTNGTD